MDLWAPSLDPLPPGAMGYSFEYKLLEVAHFWRMEWDQFDALDGDEQALLIAHYETRRRFEAVDYCQNRPDETGKSRRFGRRRR